MRYLGLCCIAKDEDEYLAQWVVHHALLGVERFLIYDNESAVPIAKTLRPLMRGDFIEVLRIEGRQWQMPAYFHCLKTFGPELRWLGFLDVDEYLAPKSCDDMRVYLADFEEFGGFGVNQVHFSSSGRLSKPRVPEIEAYHERLDYKASSDLIKSFVQPRRTLLLPVPHHAVYLPGFFCVNENREPVPASHSPLSIRDIQLNHYYYRSQEDFWTKVARGRADTTSAEDRRRHEEFYVQARAPVFPDHSAARFIPPLRRILEKNRLDQVAGLARGGESSQDLTAVLTAVREAIVQDRWDEAQRILCAASLTHENAPEFRQARDMVRQARARRRDQKFGSGM